MSRRRALIVAIETYAAIDGMTKNLDGTHQAATRFREWLLNDQNVLPEDIYVCSEDPAFEGRTAGATRDEIVDELGKLAEAGRNKTTELYFLFIGHGLSYKDVNGADLVDLILAANYSTHAKADRASLQVTLI